MKVKTIAVAGTLESSDIMVTVEPTEEKGIRIELNSSVEKQFGKQIRHCIDETITNLGIENAIIKAVDKGALDCTIKARVTAAIHRACESSEYVWEVS